MSTDLSKFLINVKDKLDKLGNVVFDPNLKLERIPSGSLAADLVLGGGFPRGRITEIFGMEHCGKTALITAAHAQVQKMGLNSIMLDFESSFIPSFAKSVFDLTVDNKTFTVFTPDYLEKGDAILDLIVKESTLDLALLTIDSAAAAIPKEYVEQAMDTPRRPGYHAMMLGHFVRKLTGFASQKNIAVVFTNQMRSRINASNPMQRSMLGQGQGVGAGFNPMELWTTPGGNGLRFASSIRMKMEYGKKINATIEDPVTGELVQRRVAHDIKLINVKNKTFVPFLQTVGRFNFIESESNPLGWDSLADAFYFLKGRGYIEHRGVKFIYKGDAVKEWTFKGNSVEAIKKFRESPELVQDAINFVKKLSEESLRSLTSGEPLLESERRRIGVEQDSEGGGTVASVFDNILEEDE